MSSNSWSIVEALAAAAAASITVHLWHTLPDNIHSRLKQYDKELKDIKERINELSPDLRECIRIAAEQGKCSSLEQLQPKLLDLLDDRFVLLHEADQSNFLERNLPARLSKLWPNIKRLEGAIKALQYDTWESTTIRLREGSAQVGVLPKCVSIDPQAWTHPHTSSSERTIFGGPSGLPQRHSGQHPEQYSGQPQWHPLDTRQSTHAHTQSRNNAYSTGLNLSIRPKSW